MLRTYFRAFRKNFRQDTLIFLLFLVFLAANYVNMAQFSQIGKIIGFLLFLISLLIPVLPATHFRYACPLLNQSHNTVPAIVKNALPLGTAHRPRTVPMLLISCFPWALIFVNLYAFIQLDFRWFALYFSAAAYYNSRILHKVFVSLPGPFRSLISSLHSKNTVPYPTLFLKQFKPSCILQLDFPRRSHQMSVSNVQKYTFAAVQSSEFVNLMQSNIFD